METNDIKMNADICRIIRQYLSDEEIDNNYYLVCKKLNPSGNFYQNSMNEVIKECRKLALKTIPKDAFNSMQIFYIRKKLGFTDYGRS